LGSESIAFSYAEWREFATLDENLYGKFGFGSDEELEECSDEELLFACNSDKELFLCSDKELSLCSDEELSLCSDKELLSYSDKELILDSGKEFFFDSACPDPLIARYSDKEFNLCSDKEFNSCSDEEIRESVNSDKELHRNIDYSDKETRNSVGSEKESNSRNFRNKIYNSQQGFSSDSSTTVSSNISESNKSSKIILSTEVRLAKGLVLKAKTQIFVRVKFDESFLIKNKLKYGFVVPSTAIGATTVKLATGVLTPKNKWVLISNWGEGDVTVKEGALLGHLVINEMEIFSLDSEDNEDLFMPDVIVKDLKGTFSSMESESKMTRAEFVKELSGKVNEDLKEEEKAKLTDFLFRWRHIFSQDPNRPGISTKTECTVPLVDPSMAPIRSRYYRFSPKVVQDLKVKVEEMLRDGVIRKSSSPWSFPVVMAAKPDGSWRFCVDYSRLSKYVRRDAFALPRVDDTLDRLREARFMTVVDCSSGFWQVKLKESDREILAFITPFGNYEWTVMPFGFTNSPAVFQRAIAETLDSYLFQCVLVFIDDICVYSRTFEEHMEHLEGVFSALDRYGWSLKLKKCQFAQQEIRYLGHQVGGGKVKPLESNMEKLRAMKIPAEPYEIVQLLGLTGYYKQFIQGYDYLVQPLRKLTHHGEKWEWGEEQKRAYDRLMHALTTEPILRLPDYSRRFIVKSDCSGWAWGAVLAQEYDGVEYPVQFASGQLTEAGRNSWPTWKREAFAVFKAISKWEHYLLGTEFDIVTDHEALKSILDPQKSHPPIINGWKLQLAKFEYVIHHRPGNSLVLEDWMSRSPELLSIDLAKIVEEQPKDRIIGPIMRRLFRYEMEELESDKENLPKVLKEIDCGLDKFSPSDEIVGYVEVKNSKRHPLRICLPESLEKEVFEHFHAHPSAGHLGLAKFWFNLSKEYWAPNLYTRAKEYVENCDVCALNRNIKKFNSEMKHVEATRPLQVLQLDHVEVGVTSTEGYNYILSIEDVFTRKVWWLPSKRVDARETMNLLMNHIFANDDFCEFFISDNHGAFDNELNSLICKASDITRRFNLPYEKIKGATGGVENKNRIVWSILRKYVDAITQTDWPDYLWHAASAYNKSPSSALGGSICPNEAYFGRKPRVLLDYGKLEPGRKEEYLQRYTGELEVVWNRVRAALAEANVRMEKQRKRYLGNRRLDDIAQGDWILLRRRTENMVKGLNPKLQSKNLGPFLVREVKEELNHLVIEISPHLLKEVHRDDVILSKPPESDNVLRFKPGLDEVILVKELPLGEPKKGERIAKENEKSKLNIKSIVGRRVSVWWPTKRYWFKGIIIGYNRLLTSNLIFYDDLRSPDTAVEEDYYKVALFPVSNKVRLDKWKLLG
jgi:hypothetical protein